MAHVDQMTRVSVVGSPETVRAGLEKLIDNTGADELIATAHIFDHAARLRSFELAMAAFCELGFQRTGARLTA